MTTAPQFRVRLSGWRVGFQKIAATHLIRSHTGLDLTQSKQCVDDCLVGRERMLVPVSEQAARTLAAELHRIGARVSLE